MFVHTRQPKPTNCLLYGLWGPWHWYWSKPWNIFNIKPKLDSWAHQANLTKFSWMLGVQPALLMVQVSSKNFLKQK